MKHRKIEIILISGIILTTMPITLWVFTSEVVSLLYLEFYSAGTILLTFVGLILMLFSFYLADKEIDKSIQALHKAINEAQVIMDKRKQKEEYLKKLHMLRFLIMVFSWPDE